MNCKVIIPSTIGCILVIFGVALPFLFPKLMDSKLNSKLMIAPGSDIEKSYKKTPVPIDFTIHIFNVTNPDEYLYDGEKPILHEMGPYVYNQKRFKHNLEYDHDVGTVKYNEQKIYYFDKDRSVGSEDDMITTINPVYMTIAAKGEKGGGLGSLLSYYLWQYDPQPFITQSVKELTFSGYEDPLISGLYELTEKEKYASGKTGIFYNKNGTYDDVREVYTGESRDGESGRAHHVYKFHNMSFMDFWKNDNCGVINGTFGTMFPRPLSSDMPVYMLSSDLCRAVKFDYEKDVMYGPLKLLRYVLSEEVIGVTEVNKQCFYWEDFFARRAMYDVSRCKDGAPVVMSTPHFYAGDQADIDSFEGLSPIKEKHEIYLDIEPNTGVLIRGSKRLQVNFAVRQYTKMFTHLEDVQELVFPVLWVDESVAAPMKRVEALHESLTRPKQLVGYISIASIVVGVILLLVAICIICVDKNKEKKNKLKIESDKKASKLLLEKNGYTQNETEKA